MNLYQQLLREIQIKGQVEIVVKKLMQLISSDQTNFKLYVKTIMKKINRIINDQQYQKYLQTIFNLMIQIIRNFKNQISLNEIQLQTIIKTLANQKVFYYYKQQCRKKAHSLILTLCKNYKHCTPIIFLYNKIIESQENWKLIQKCIHSWQSLIVSYPNIIQKVSTNCINVLIENLLKKVQDEIISLKKASEQVNLVYQSLQSFCKNQVFINIINEMNQSTKLKLKSFSESYNININIEIKEDKNVQKQSIIQNYEKNIINKPKMYNDQKIINQNRNKQIINILSGLKPQNQWFIKCQKIQTLQNILTPLPQILPNQLLKQLPYLINDSNFKISLTSLNLLQRIIKQKQLNSQIQYIYIITLIDKLAQPKHSIRQVAAKIISYKIKEKQWFDKLLQVSKKGNSLIKQQFINIINNCQQTPFVIQVLTFLSNLIQQQKPKLKMKSIDALVNISLKNNIQYCKNIILNKLNQVYYDMYLERLYIACKQKKIIQQQQQWKQQKNKNNEISNSNCQVKQISHTFFSSQNIQQKDNNIPENSRIGQKMIQTKTTAKTFNSMNTSTNNMQLAMKSYNTSYNMFQQTAFSSQSCRNPHNKINQQKNEINQKNKNILQMKSFTLQKTKQKFKDKESQNESKKSLYMNKHQKQQQQQQLQQNKIKVKIKDQEQKKELQKYYYKPPIVKKKKKQQEQQHKQQTKQTTQKALIIHSYKKPSEQSKQQKRVLKQKSLAKKNIQFQQKDQIKQLTKPFKSNFNKKKSNQGSIPDYKATGYLSPNQLKPFQYPQNQFKIILTQIKKDQDWSRQFQALNMLRRLNYNHPNQILKNSANFGQLIGYVLKLIQSLRSNLTKNSIIALNELVQANKKLCEVHAEAIFTKLFKKTLDTNTFIGQEVKKSLVCITGIFNQAKVVPILLNHSQNKVNFVNKATQIKLHVMLCIQKLIDKLRGKFCNMKEFNRLIIIMANYISDASIEIRNLSKKVFLELYSESPKEEFEQLLKRNISEQQYIKLKSIVQKQGINKLIIKNSKNYESDDF